MFKATITAAIFIGTTTAFLTPTIPSTRIRHHQSKINLTRQDFIALTTATVASTILPPPSSALVKGNAPPPKKETSERKCRNVEECQEMAEQQEALRQRVAMQEAEASGVKPVVVGGTKYLEVETGDGTKVKEGDGVEVYYKVLKLGKRSYDGLSGEGTVRMHSLWLLRTWLALTCILVFEHVLRLYFPEDMDWKMMKRQQVIIHLLLL
jgi:hypothetical protein